MQEPNYVCDQLKSIESLLQNLRSDKKILSTHLKELNVAAEFLDTIRNTIAQLRHWGHDMHGDLYAENLSDLQKVEFLREHWHQFTLADLEQLIYAAKSV